MIRFKSILPLITFLFIGLSSSYAQDSSGEPNSGLSTQSFNLKSTKISTIVDRNSNQLDINGITIGGVAISILNLSGQEVKKTNTTQDIDISNLTSGMYFVRITVNNQSVAKKVIIP